MFFVRGTYVVIAEIFCMASLWLQKLVQFVGYFCLFILVDFLTFLQLFIAKVFCVALTITGVLICTFFLFTSTWIHCCLATTCSYGTRQRVYFLQSYTVFYCSFFLPAACSWNILIDVGFYIILNTCHNLNFDFHAHSVNLWKRSFQLA